MAEYRTPNLNRVLIIGNLTAEPDLRYMPNGQAVLNFQIAYNQKYKDKKSGEWKDGTPTFVRVVLYGQTAEHLGEILKKGHAVFVEGKLQTRSWETSEGNKRSMLEIIASRAQSLVKMSAESQKPDVKSDEENKEGLPF